MRPGHQQQLISKFFASLSLIDEASLLEVLQIEGYQDERFRRLCAEISRVELPYDEQKFSEEEFLASIIKQLQGEDLFKNKKEAFCLRADFFLPSQMKDHLLIILI